MPTITSNDPLATIKLCPSGSFIDNVEITGFEISNTVGSGIVGFLNEGLVIRDNVVTGNGGFGIALLNASGDTVNSPTAPVSTFRIQNNTLTQNNQGGLLIADVDLATFDLTPAGVDISAKGVSLADRGDLNVQVSGNTISDNATTDTLSFLGEALSDATLRDDRFGVQVVSLTGSQITANFESNTLERNGTAAALGRFSSAGGLSVLAGGTSIVNATVTESTFNRNAGSDIQAITGDGPVTQDSAQVVLNVNRSLLQNAQLSETDDGVRAAGVWLNSTAGTIVANIDSTVILGDSTVLNSTFDRMEALYATAQGTGQITTTVQGTDINALGRSGNEFVGWHVGAGSSVLDTGSSSMTIIGSLIDAQCVLKFHSGIFGDPAASSLTASIQDSELIARLPTTSPVHGILAEALGGSDLSLSILDTEYRFEGIVDGTTPARNWLSGTAGDTANLTLRIENGQAINAMTGFTNFIDLSAENSGTISATMLDSTIGETTGQGINIGALDSSRVTLTVERSTLSNSGAGLINVLANGQAVVSSTLTSNTLTNPISQAITMQAVASLSTDNARVGATLSLNQFLTPSGGLQATSDADDGTAEFRLNMTDNTSTGQFLLEQLQSAPGVSAFALFDGGGNSPAATTTGTVTNSPTLLDIAFP
ncbi:MAG: right-handed parallel beta-helix repeat-containing protein [Planctomycetota bacterium]|nr:right-handed parallel beta-helix repeat-containing protein [Planctomycetota bacterium]